MAEEDEPDWDAIARELADVHRPYAGYWSWESDRTIEERGVLKEFTESLARSNRLFFNNPRHTGRGNDPPDCEADDRLGGRIGIELTELVDGASIAVARQGHVPPWKFWTEETVINRITERIRIKDARLARTTDACASVVLVIYSDEDFPADSIADHTFPATVQIDRVFLLMSYCPITRGCPCVELRLAGG